MMRGRAGAAPESVDAWRGRPAQVTGWGGGSMRGVVPLPAVNGPVDAWRGRSNAGQREIELDACRGALPGSSGRA